MFQKHSPTLCGCVGPDDYGATNSDGQHCAAMPHVDRVCVLLGFTMCLGEKCRCFARVVAVYDHIPLVNTLLAFSNGRGFTAGYPCIPIMVSFGGLSLYPQTDSASTCTAKGDLSAKLDLRLDALFTPNETQEPQKAKKKHQRAQSETPKTQAQQTTRAPPGPDFTFTFEASFVLALLCTSGTFVPRLTKRVLLRIWTCYHKRNVDKREGVGGGRSRGALRTSNEL